MNGVKPGDRVWIFRSEVTGSYTELGFRNVGKTMLVLREAHWSECGNDGGHWLVEVLEPCVCSVTGDIVPAGGAGVVLKSCVKPLRDPDADSQPTSNLEELTA